MIDKIQFARIVLYLFFLGEIIRMKKLFNISKVFFVVLLVLSCFSCATTKLPEVPTLTKYDDMMFWKIEGVDSKGKLATIYVLGTIHVGDEELYPIPEVITNAYESADRVYGEISTQGWSELTGKTLSRVLTAMADAKAYTLETGILWYDTLTSEQKNFLETKLGKTVVDANKELMPWVLYSGLSDLAMTGSGLTAAFSYDVHFISLSNQLEIEMLGLDDVDVQLDVLSYGDMDFQVKMMKDTIDKFLENPDFEKEETIALYNAYLSGDEKKLEEVLFAGMEEEIAANPEMQGYYNALFVDRNINWAEIFTQLIAEGGQTFVFAGSGHFIGADSVFDFMKRKGDLVF